jgi:hypothetical protein
MFTRARVSLLCLLAVVPLLLISCNSGVKPLSVTLSASTTQALMAGQTVTITAAVAHDKKNAGVSWTLSGPGALSNQTSTSVTYTAPSTVGAVTTATVTGTSVTDSSKVATATINLQAVSISLTPSAAQPVDQGQTMPVTATVSGDPTNKGVTWSLSGTGGGTLSGPTATAVTYNAPASVATAGSATVTATSVFDGTKTQTLTINLVTPPSVTTTSLTGGQAGVAYSATLAGANGIAPYTWSIVSGAPPAGINLSGSTISGTPTAAGTANFTVQVKDAGGLTATEPLGINVKAGVVTISPASGSTLPAATVGQAYSATITASGGVPPYVQWTLNPSTASSWLVAMLSAGNTQTVTLSGTPGTGDVGTINGITISVQDSETPTAVPASATYSLTVNAGTATACNSGGSESMLKGQYAFVLTGFDNGQEAGESVPQPALVGGVLTFNGSNGNGLITAGMLDMNINAGVQTKLAVSSGSYGVGSDQRGCMVITTSAGTQNYRFALGNLSGGVAATAHVVDFDTTGPFVVGTMRRQTAAAFGTGSGQITGNYVFGVSSAQNSAIGGKFGALGIFNFAAGSITDGQMDMNLNGVLDGNSENASWPTSNVPINSGGTYTVDSGTGRGVFTFTPSGGNAVNGILYVVSASEVLALSADTQNSANIWAGEIKQQSGTPFASNPLNGMFIEYDSGLGGGSGRTDISLLGTFIPAESSFSYLQWRNDSGTFSSQPISNATYSVNAFGRVTVSGVPNHDPVLYLVSASEGFLLSGNGSVDSGYLQSQTSVAGPNGTYGLGNIEPQASGSTLNSGAAVFDAENATVSVTLDQNKSGSLTPNNTQGFNDSVTSGAGYIPSGCTITVSSTTCMKLFYVISGTKTVVMDISTGSPRLTIADQ